MNEMDLVERANHYYFVANDLQIQANALSQMVVLLVQMADDLSEEASRIAPEKSPAPDAGGSP